jgi:hypothetical protein
VTPLDALVRRSLIKHPLIFQSRWDVLVHLFLVIGNGYEWQDGQLVAVYREDEDWDEEYERGEFFRDLDDLERQFGTSADLRLARARRQFQLDHIEDLIHESRHNYRPGGMSFERLATISKEYSHALNAPPMVEASFLEGAIEVLQNLMQQLYYLAEGDKDDGLRDVVAEQLERLRGMRRGAA